MLDGSSVDRPLPEIWATLIDAPFEENDGGSRGRAEHTSSNRSLRVIGYITAIFGLQTLQDYCVPGYKPEKCVNWSTETISPALVN
jgi:hypothetical protein